MEPIDREVVQQRLESFVNTDVYMHLETTNGAYAGEAAGGNGMAVCAFVRNARVRFSRAQITGSGVAALEPGPRLTGPWLWDTSAALQLVYALAFRRP